MIEVLRKLLELAESGRLDIENLRLNDMGHTIDIGHAVTTFEGEITLEVSVDADVIEFGNMLKQAMDKNN